MIMNFNNNNYLMIKTFLLLLILCLLTSSCCKRKLVICNCPKSIDYSKEFQNNLVKELDKVKDNYYINQVIIDWFNLNKELKECYE